MSVPNRGHPSGIRAPLEGPAPYLLGSQDGRKQAEIIWDWGHFLIWGGGELLPGATAGHLGARVPAGGLAEGAAVSRWDSG